MHCLIIIDKSWSQGLESITCTPPVFREIMQWEIRVADQSDHPAAAGTNNCSSLKLHFKQHSSASQALTYTLEIWRVIFKKTRRENSHFLKLKFTIPLKQLKRGETRFFSWRKNCGESNKNFNCFQLQATAACCYFYWKKHMFLSRILKIRAGLLFLIPIWSFFSNLTNICSSSIKQQISHRWLIARTSFRVWQAKNCRKPKILHRHLLWSL